MIEDIVLSSTNAEIKVLAFLMDRTITKEDKSKALQLLTDEHFTDGDNKVLFSTIKKTKQFDPIMLLDKLIAASSALPDITQYDDKVTKEEADSYIDILLDKYQKRGLYEFAEGIKRSLLDGKDQFELALRAQSVLTSISAKVRIERNVEILDRVLSESPDDVIKTGYDGLNQYLGGYSRGMIITIAGDSGHLKTTLALDKAFKMAEQNPSLKIGIFSKEMLSTELVKKQISRICGIPSNKLFSQNYDKEFVRNKMMEIDAWREDRIRIISPDSFSGVGDIARIQMSQRFDIWFLDFIQLLEFAKSANTSSDYNIQIAQNMRNLQSLSIGTKSVGIILSQVKKGVDHRKEKKPTVSDIEWSGLIKQLSSYIFFSYYPGKYYGFDKIPADNYFLLGEKTRFAENFVYPMKVNAEFGTFTEIKESIERQSMMNKMRNLVGS